MIKIGIPKISSGLKELLRGIPWEAKTAGRRGWASVLYNHLRQNSYPPQNYVTRKQAYGQTFQSDRQRRWFFAALNSGEINVPYQRTGHLGEAWQWDMKPRSDIIYNDSPYEKWTIGNARSEHEKLVGWKFWLDTAHQVLPEAIQAAVTAINDWFASRPWMKRR